MKDMDINTTEQIQYLIKNINMKMRHILLKELDNMSLTIHQIHIMKIIQENPTTNLTCLGNRLNLAKSSISLTINKLVHQGYVLRKENSEDRRNIYLTLSEKGHRVLDETRRKQRHIFHALLAYLSIEELTEIEKNLNKLDKAIEEALQSHY